MATRLNESIPANNVKIIELYNKLRAKSLEIRPDFQRKLVWKKIHKYNFIETVLLNYPFPEIYIAPGELDQVNITLTEKVVDGQQRLSTISDYIEGVGVFSAAKCPIKKFSELNALERANFLNYEVSVRYLKNASEEQTKEIFQRINRTDYALNKIERFNAQWGDSEFVCFAKQIIDGDYNNSEASYKIAKPNILRFQKFFNGETPIFTETDTSRMSDLQYLLTILATIVGEEYFQRNDKVESYVEAFNEEFSPAPDIEDQLLKTLETVMSLNLEKDSIWLNKTNLFSLIVELYKYDQSAIKITPLSDHLKTLEKQYKYWLLDETSRSALDKEGRGYTIENDTNQFFQNSRVAVNDKGPRIQRGNFIQQIISDNLK